MCLCVCLGGGGGFQQSDRNEQHSSSLARQPPSANRQKQLMLAMLVSLTSPDSEKWHGGRDIQSLGAVPDRGCVKSLSILTLR